MLSDLGTFNSVRPQNQQNGRPVIDSRKVAEEQSYEISPSFKCFLWVFAWTDKVELVNKKYEYSRHVMSSKVQTVVQGRH